MNNSMFNALSGLKNDKNEKTDNCIPNGFHLCPDFTGAEFIS